MVIRSLLSAYGILSALYIAYCDLKTTVLPERLVKSLVPAGLLGWLLLGGTKGFMASAKTGLFYFLFGYALYITRHWASGDAWVLAGLGTIFGPMIPGFATYYPVIAVMVGFIWSFMWYMYFLFVSDLVERVKLEVSLFFTLPFVAYFLPSIYPIYFYLIVLSILIKTYSDIDKKIVLENPAVALEEDDWLVEDLKLGDKVIRADRPVRKKEVRLAKELGGKKKIRVKIGVPFIPVLAISLLISMFFLE